MLSSNHSNSNQTLSIDAVTSMLSFLLGVLILPFYYLLSILQTDYIMLVISYMFYLFFSLVLVHIGMNKLSRHMISNQCDRSGNIRQAFFLGCVSALGFYMILLTVHGHSRLFWPFGSYLVLLSLFHWSEFFITSLCNPTACSLDIYMLNHSPEYLMAISFSMLEYWIRNFFFPQFPPIYICSIAQPIGLFVCLGGEFIRKYAMWTAATNFNHHIEHVARSDHQLVTWGVYSWFRHPAYVGWFYWVLGTQLLLSNPVCSFTHMFIAHRFFQSRVLHEESLLLIFFGDEYRAYQRRVGTGIPFIRGYFN